MVDTAVTDTVLDTVDTMVVMLVILIVLMDTDTTTARGLLMPNPRLMLMPLLMPTTDTTAVDTDTDTDTTVKFLPKQQIFKSHISSPIIELSIYQTRLPPALTYIQKKVKNIWTKSKKLNFF